MHRPPHPSQVPPPVPVATRVSGPPAVPIAVQAPATGQRAAEKGATMLVVVGCFVLLAWLNGRHVTSGAGHVAVYTVIGLALLVIGLLAVVAVNLLSDPSVLGRWGFAAVWAEVARGFLTFLPFTLLALLAELAYKWHAAPAFIQASITTAGAAAGVELMRHLAPRRRYVIASMIVSIFFTIVWTIFGYVFARVVG